MKENFNKTFEVVERPDLNEAIRNIAEVQNEKYGEILNSDASIKMEKFPGADIYSDQEEVLSKEMEWSDANTDNPKRLAFFADKKLDTPEERLEYWRKNKERSAPEKLEKAVLYLFHKFLHDDFLVARSSVYDDYFNGVDTIIVDPKTQKVIGAFDEFREHYGSERGDEKLQKIIKKASRGGAHLKYGLNFGKPGSEGEQEVVRKELYHIPVFRVALGEDEMENLLNGMNGEVEGEPTEEERVILNKILDSFDSQIKILEKPENRVKGYTLENVKVFKKALGKIRGIVNFN